jgi:hypothetical protein
VDLPDRRFRALDADLLMDRLHSLGVERLRRLLSQISTTRQPPVGLGPATWRTAPSGMFSDVTPI